MNTLKIIQSESAQEYNVPASIIPALVSISESINSDDNIQLLGTINISSGVYQDDVNYLTGTTGRFPNFHINATAYYIKFADQNTLNVLINGGVSSDGIGVSITDARSATSIPTFKDNTSVVSFDELSYFTNVTRIGNRCFWGCTNLTSLVLPSSLIEIGYLCFGRSGIQRLVIPSSVTTLDNQCFWDSSIRTIIFEGTTPPEYLQGNSTKFLYNLNLSGLKIYVPDGYVTDYQQASGWADNASIVYPISSLTQS